MARVKLEIPKQFAFSVELTVRITDLNYGGHLGNDRLLSLMHEARVLFFQQYGYSELNFGTGGIIMSDAAIQYKSEAFAGDILQFQVTACEFSMTSFDLFYYITCKQDGRVVAVAKTLMVCFDYSQKKTLEVPQEFKNRFV